MRVSSTTRVSTIKPTNRRRCTRRTGRSSVAARASSSSVRTTRNGSVITFCNQPAPATIPWDCHSRAWRDNQHSAERRITNTAAIKARSLRLRGPGVGQLQSLKALPRLSLLWRLLPRQNSAPRKARLSNNCRATNCPRPKLRSACRKGSRSPEEGMAKAKAQTLHARPLINTTAAATTLGSQSRRRGNSTTTRTRPLNSGNSRGLAACIQPPARSIGSCMAWMHSNTSPSTLTVSKTMAVMRHRENVQPLSTDVEDASS